MSGPVEIVLVVAALGYVLTRRLVGEPAQGRRLVVLPAALSLVGLFGIPAGESPWSWAALGVGAALSVGIGALRGASVRILDADGVALVRYTWITVAWWAVAVAVKFGIHVVSWFADPHHVPPLSSGLMLTLGLGMLAEGAVICSRAVRSGHAVDWQPRRAGVSPTSSSVSATRAGTFGQSAPQSGRPADEDPDRSTGGFSPEAGLRDVRLARRARRR